MRRCEWHASVGGGAVADRQPPVGGVLSVAGGSASEGWLDGSGIALSGRGTHVLKGVPETWRLFAVEG